MRRALDFLFELIDDEVLDQELDKKLEGGSKENNNYFVCSNSFLRVNITVYLKSKKSAMLNHIVTLIQLLIVRLWFLVLSLASIFVFR